MIQFSIGVFLGEHSSWNVFLILIWAVLERKIYVLFSSENACVRGLLLNYWIFPLDHVCLYVCVCPIYQSSNMTKVWMRKRIYWEQGEEKPSKCLFNTAWLWRLPQALFKEIVSSVYSTHLHLKRICISELLSLMPANPLCQSFLLLICMSVVQMGYLYCGWAPNKNLNYSFKKKGQVKKEENGLSNDGNTW